MKQLSHHQTNFQQKEFPVVLLLDQVSGEANIGSIFRLADAFGIQKLIFTGNIPNLDSRRLQKTSRNTHKIVDFQFYEDKIEAVREFQKMGYQLLALEITAGSKSVAAYNFEKNDKICLIIGNEAHGVSESLLKLCKSAFHIEMFGNNSSMNVAQATGIALYEITKSIRAFHKK